MSSRRGILSLWPLWLTVLFVFCSVLYRGWISGYELRDVLIGAVVFSGLTFLVLGAATLLVRKSPD